ncbi:hypothetical protein Tco_0523422 [Tanacetum coccineum]
MNSEPLSLADSSSISFRATPQRNLSFLSTRERISNRRLASYEGNGHNMSKGNIIKIFYHGLSKITQEVLNAAAGGIFLYKTQIRLISFWKTRIMARMDAMTLKMDAQYKELKTHAKKTKPDLDEDDIPMSREEEANFMQTFHKTRFYNDYRDRDSNSDNWRSNE